MAKLKRDTSQYTSFGMLLHALCLEQGLSFRELARTSGMSPNSHMAIVRACRGQTFPQRDTLLRWCHALQANPKQQKQLLHYWHYTTPEDERDNENITGTQQDQFMEQEQYKKRIL